MHVQTYTVQGLTCGSCIAEVMELARTLPGVSGVSIAYSEHDESPMFIESRKVVSLEDVRAALETRGFRVSGAGRRRTRRLMFQVSGRVA